MICRRRTSGRIRSGGSTIPGLGDQPLHPFVDVRPLRTQPLGLLLGVIAGSDQRTALTDFEACRKGRLAKPREFVGVHPAVDRKVVSGGLQVLPDREDVAVAPGPDIAQELENLVLMLADPQHDARLGDETVRLELLEDLQASLVPRLWPDRGVYAIDRLHVD